MSNFKTEVDDIKEEAALLLLKTGQATVAEAAKLRGVSRQAVHKALTFDARQRRRKYLRTRWQELVNRLTS